MLSKAGSVVLIATVALAQVPSSSYADGARVLTGSATTTASAPSSYNPGGNTGGTPSSSYNTGGTGGSYGSGGSAAPPASGSSSAETHENYITAHGTLMLIAWGVLIPTGVLSAHFLRHIGGNWFVLHRVFAATGLLFALVGWIIALAQFDVFHGAITKYSMHGGLGHTVMVLGLLQPINAFFRPHPAEDKTPRRRLWEHCHKKAGYLAVVLGIATISLGVTLPDGPNESSTKTGFLIAFILALLYLLAFHSWASLHADKHAAGSRAPAAPGVAAGGMQAEHDKL